MHIETRVVRAAARLNAFLMLGLLVGCTAVVKPPPEPRAPVPVFLLDHGWHASLVLPQGEGLARYAYGDWEWYAHRRTGAGKAISALFTPSEAALGRRFLAGPATPESILRQMRVEVKRMYVIPVDPMRARMLTDRLDTLFQERQHEAVYNADYDLDFVPHPDLYGLGHNSNHVVAKWLRELGCTVEGPGTVGDWKVEGIRAIELSAERDEAQTSSTP